MLPRPPILPASGTRREFARLAAQQPSSAIFLVESRGLVVGFIRHETALQALDDPEASVLLGAIVETNYATVGEQTTLLDVLGQMRATRAFIALVTEGSGPVTVNNVKGVITERQIAETTMKAAELFVDPPQERKSSTRRTIIS